MKQFLGALAPNCINLFPSLFIQSLCRIFTLVPSKLVMGGCVIVKISFSSFLTLSSNSLFLFSRISFFFFSSTKFLLNSPISSSFIFFSIPLIFIIYSSNIYCSSSPVTLPLSISASILHPSSNNSITPLTITPPSIIFRINLTNLTFRLTFHFPCRYPRPIFIAELFSNAVRRSGRSLIHVTNIFRLTW